MTAVSIPVSILNNETVLFETAFAVGASADNCAEPANNVQQEGLDNPPTYTCINANKVSYMFMKLINRK